MNYARNESNITLIVGNLVCLGKRTVQQQGNGLLQVSGNYQLHFESESYLDFGALLYNFCVTHSLFFTCRIVVDKILLR